MLLLSTEVWFVSRGRRRAHGGGHRPLRILLARFVLSATATTVPLPLPRKHSAPNGRASPILSETGASTPFNRISDTRKSSVHDASRKSAGASSPSCTNTRSPRTTSVASTSFHAPSRRTHASSVMPVRKSISESGTTIYALRDTTCVGAHRRQRRQARQQTTDHGGAVAWWPRFIRALPR